MKKTPAIPLFIYRKRQKEAVFSDPLQLSTINNSNTGTSENNSFNSKSYSDGKQKLQTSNTLNSQVKQNLISKQGTNAWLSSSKINSGQYQSTTALRSNTGSANNFTFKPSNSAYTTTTGSSKCIIGPSKNLPPTSLLSKNGNVRVKSGINTNSYSSSFIYKGNSISQGVSIPSFKSNNKEPSTAASAGLTLNRKENIFNRNKQASISSVNKATKFVNSPSFETTSVTTTNKNETTTLDMQSKAKKESKDISMRIFTCSISTMKTWAACNITNMLVMFEVFGVVDSATVKDSSGTGKEFTLRDDTSSIKCIFFEIDRELPRLIRGQVHRVIGRVMKDVLHIVHVRAAHKDERQVCILASEVSQKAMDEVMRRNSEQ